VVRRATGGARHVFLLGLTTGAVYFSGTLYWLVDTMTTFGGLPVPIAAFAAALLVAYLSLFPGAFAVILARLYRHIGPRALLLAPAIWVTTELGRQYIWDGFPWALLGYSQVTTLSIAQVASIVGVYGVSGLVALTATATAFLMLDRTRTAWVVAASVAALVTGSAAWGSARLRASSLLTAGVPVRVAVLQGNIAQEDKWNPALGDAITQRYVAMTREAIAQGATFILWPESSTPFYLGEDIIRGGAIRRLASDARVTLLIGSDLREAIAGAAASASEKYRYYNAAFLVKPDGTSGAIYRKMHLVPFGEYVPLQSLLFFVGPIIAGVGDFAPFTAGAEPVFLPLGDHHVSAAICYEVIYADLIRRSVLDGSELLTTITNDAWYGRSSAAYQHWEQASMRAIEEGRYLARAANTGVSGFVDPYGRVIARTDLFVQATAVQNVRFIRERTVYNRIGDLVAWLSLAITAAALLATRRARRHAARADG
jgi:apolipoprotein N-acyltransferase